MTTFPARMPSLTAACGPMRSPARFAFRAMPLREGGLCVRPASASRGARPLRAVPGLKPALRPVATSTAPSTADSRRPDDDQAKLDSMFGSAANFKGTAVKIVAGATFTLDDLDNNPLFKLAITKVTTFGFWAANLLKDAIYDPWTPEEIWFIIAYHYGINLFYKLVEDKAPKDAWYTKLIYSVQKPLMGIKYLWGALWVVDQIALASAYFGQSLLPKTFLEGAPGAAYTMFAGYMFSLYIRPALEKTGWFNERTLDPVEKLCKLVTTFTVTAVASFTVGLPIESVLALGGASGLAIGLATQDLVKNFMGGLMLATRRPFTNGDKVKIGSYVGKVVDYGWYDTTLTRDDGSPTYIPNASFVANPIFNENRRTIRYFDQTFTVAFEQLFNESTTTPSEKCEKLKTNVRKRLMAVEMAKGFREADTKVNATKLLPNGVEFKCKVFLDPKCDWDTAQHQLLMAVADGVAESGFKMVDAITLK